MSKRISKSVRLGVEAMDARLVPSVTFQENTGAPHSLTVTAADHQNNSIVVVNDGNGNLKVTADGTVRNFTGVTSLKILAGDGADTVVYNQGSSGHEADIVRGLAVDVRLGDNKSGTTDKFTANVFGDVTNASALTFKVAGEGGHDRIDINAHDVDVHGGSTLGLFLTGDGGGDTITVDSDGEIDGKMFLRVSGNDGNDAIAVNVLMDSGSTGSVEGGDAGQFSGSAFVTGDFGNDKVTFAVRQQSGSAGAVSAVIDGGLGLFDHDIGHRTNNIRSQFLEEDFVIP